MKTVNAKQNKFFKQMVTGDTTPSLIVSKTVTEYDESHMILKLSNRIHEGLRKIDASDLPPSRRYASAKMSYFLAREKASQMATVEAPMNCLLFTTPDAVHVLHIKTMKCRQLYCANGMSVGCPICLDKHKKLLLVRMSSPQEIKYVVLSFK